MQNQNRKTRLEDEELYFNLNELSDNLDLEELNRDNFVYSNIGFQNKDTAKVLSSMSLNFEKYIEEQRKDSNEIKDLLKQSIKINLESTNTTKTLALALTSKSNNYFILFLILYIANITNRETPKTESPRPEEPATKKRGRSSKCHKSTLFIFYRNNWRRNRA